MEGVATFKFDKLLEEGEAIENLARDWLVALEPDVTAEAKSAIKANADSGKPLPAWVLKSVNRHTQHSDKFNNDMESLPEALKEFCQDILSEDKLGDKKGEERGFKRSAKS